MLIVGLTGGVASGKSTVSKVLREEGAYISMQTGLPENWFSPIPHPGKS
jgi:cytidylate kinase